MAENLETCRHLNKAANFYGVSRCINVLFLKQIQEFSALLGHAMERGRNRVTHWGSDSVVTLRYFS